MKSLHKDWLMACLAFACLALSIFIMHQKNTVDNLSDALMLDAYGDLMELKHKSKDLSEDARKRKMKDLLYNLKIASEHIPNHGYLPYLLRETIVYCDQAEGTDVKELRSFASQTLEQMPHSKDRLPEFSTFAR